MAKMMAMACLLCSSPWGHSQPQRRCRGKGDGMNFLLCSLYKHHLIWSVIDAVYRLTSSSNCQLALVLFDERLEPSPIHLSHLFAQAPVFRILTWQYICSQNKLLILYQLIKLARNFQLTQATMYFLKLASGVDSGPWQNGSTKIRSLFFLLKRS